MATRGRMDGHYFRHRKGFGMRSIRFVLRTVRRGGRKLLFGYFAFGRRRPGGRREGVRLVFGFGLRAATGCSPR
jgi:hypothetical protein